MQVASGEQFAVLHSFVSGQQKGEGTKFRRAHEGAHKMAACKLEDLGGRWLPDQLAHVGAEKASRDPSLPCERLFTHQSRPCRCQ